ncbi:MAG: coenzyme F420-0:L-glutamate ligase [Candidatus Bathyarchaeia archaeon]
MTKYHALAIATEFWKPRTDFAASIVEAVRKRVAEGDFVVVSEKALSTAQNNILDESTVIPSANARFLAKVWMPRTWGSFLGVLCRLGQRLRRRVREYPADAGSRHKQVALEYGGLLQALMFGSEGGIDGSNLPYSFVSLPLNNAPELAEEIRQRIRQQLSLGVNIVIVDTDKTYSFRNFHFTPRPHPMKGIQSHGGVVAYVLARFLKLRKRPTPLAVAGCELRAEEALTIANVADKARGPGSGATVWDMAARFRVATTEVTWEMLAKIRHKPVVLVRKDRQE